MTLELSIFCDPSRPTTRLPWSAGSYSYATNGKVAIRVSRVDSVAERPDVPTASLDKWLADENRPGDLLVLPAVTFPKPKRSWCARCDGRGSVHDCPECPCECRECEGTGEHVQDIVVRVGAIMLISTQWRLLAYLPKPRIAPALNVLSHVWFEFDGGVGIASPRRKVEDAILVEATSAAETMTAPTANQSATGT